MPRTKSKPSNTPPNRSSRSVPQEKAPIVWVNVRLSDDDVAYLEQQTTTFEQLGAMLLAIGDEGRGFSVKPMDDGKSIMCAITGEADDASGRAMGVSAFADNVRDAVLACLYKFQQNLGSTFDAGLGDVAPNTRRFR